MRFIFTLLFLSLYAEANFDASGFSSTSSTGSLNIDRFQDKKKGELGMGLSYSQSFDSLKRGNNDQLNSLDSADLNLGYQLFKSTYIEAFGRFSFSGGANFGSVSIPEQDDVSYYGASIQQVLVNSVNPLSLNLEYIKSTEKVAFAAPVKDMFKINLLQDFFINKKEFYYSLGFAHAKDSEFLGVDRENLFTYSLGTLMPLTGHLNFFAEFLGQASLSSNTQNSSTTSLYTGLNLKNSEVSFFAGVGVSELERDATLGFVSGLRFIFGRPVVPKSEVVVGEPREEQLISFKKAAKKKSKNISKKKKNDVEIKIAKTLKTKPILFNILTSNFKNEEAMDELYKVLRGEVELIETIVIVGHTDNRGKGDKNARANERLAHKRAMAVKKGLTERGISPKVIVSSSMGRYAPLKSGSSIKNRRVEIFTFLSGENNEK